MDDLIEAFSGSQVTIQQNSTAAEHPHFSLYKAKPSSSSQESRRKKFLEAQKNKRYDYTSHARRLATSEFGKAEKEEEGDENDETESMECEFKKPPRSYSNQLMLSEWLVEVPCDLDKEWYLVLCPVGKRCLVVASRGLTKIYTKSGFRITAFPSFLPGGNKNSGNSYSLLDCIYNQLDKTYYVIDVMCWNSHPCFDSETEFRFYWKNTKLNEDPEVKEITQGNSFKFIPVPHYECTEDIIKKTMWSPLPFPSKLDGLLFYHKRTHYVCGTTPLVGWLKGYMVPEMLNIEVPATYMEEKPPSYTCMQQHCPKAFAVNEQRKKEDETNMQYEEVS